MMKKIKLYRLLSLILCFIMILSLFSACANPSSSQITTNPPMVDTPDDEHVNLWIVSEVSNPGTVNSLLENLVEAYGEQHTNVSFELEYLPKNKEEREVRLDQLRTEILSGNGPDLYLMPGSHTGYQLESLFTDVTLSMYNGMFYDIGAYYNADDDLNKEELETKVMDAGTLGVARYVLPIRYDFPVLQVDSAVLSNFGLKEEDIASDLNTLMDAILESGDAKLANSFFWPSIIYNAGLDGFSDFIDYENKEVLLTTEEVADLMENYQRWMELQYGEFEYMDRAWSSRRTMADGYVTANQCWFTAGYPLHVAGLEEALHNTMIAKAQGKEISMYPLRTSDGSVIASVTYWGAVGSSCDYPDVAYDFLRQFLLQDTQWEKSRSRGDANLSGSFFEEGLPVRSEGAVGSLVESIKKQIVLKKDSTDEAAGNARRDGLLELTIDDSDFPVIDTEIDEVRLWNHAEYELVMILNSLNDSDNGYAPTDVDIEAVASEFVKQLEYLLAEG